MSDIKCRNFHGVIYPDSESYVCDDVITALDDAFVKWAYVLHDMDTDENGELKKPHIHWMGSRKTPVTIKTIANALGLAEHEVERTRQFKAMARYLIHADDPDKFQYDADKVVTNFDYGRYVTPMERSEMGMCIADYIAGNPSLTPYDLLKWAGQNGFYDEFLRGFPAFMTIYNQFRNEVSVK